MNELLGCVESPSDPRDYRLSDVSCSIGSELPLNYAIEDYVQNSTKQVGNTCVAQVLTKIKRYFNYNNDYSVGFLYGYRKEDQHQGTGLIPREALSNLCNVGDCLKSDFNYEIEYPSIADKISEVGTGKLVDLANKHKSLSFIRLSKDEIKNYLYNNKNPIMIIYKVYDNFYEAKTNKGIVPTIPKGNYVGNHAMVCYEYNGDLLTNDGSWGDVGDNGLFYVDINSTIIKEIWAIEEIKIERPITIDAWEKYLTPSGLKWKYKKDGQYITNDWLQINNDWFYFNQYGIALADEWYKDDNGDWYFFDSNCYMKTGWLLDKGNYYYLSKEHDGYYGHMLTNCYTPDGYYVDENGVWDWK